MNITDSDRHRHRHSLAATVATVSCAVALTACGGSGRNGASTPYGPANSPFALSKCMRANGVSSFPDPVAGPGGEGFNGLIMTSGGSLVVNGINLGGPALQSAEKACRAFLPPGGPPPQMSASRRLAALAFARCMRTHGVPNFPDPPSAGGPGLIGVSRAKTALGGDSQSPAFTNAAKACGNGFQVRR